MSIYFEYNKHVVDYMRRHPEQDNALHRIHLLSLKWLYDNLQNGRDFVFSGTSPIGARQGKSVLVVQELVWFDREEDLLAFRLATGL